MRKELEEKKNDLITKAEDMLNQAKMEKRELTEDEAEELAEIRDNVRKIIATLKLEDDFREMENMAEKKEQNEEEKTVEETMKEKEVQETREIEIGRASCRERV